MATLLERDICAQGPTPIEALKRLVSTVEAQASLDAVNGIEPLLKLEPPPSVYAYRAYFAQDPGGSDWTSPELIEAIKNSKADNGG